MKKQYLLATAIIFYGMAGAQQVQQHIKIQQQSVSDSLKIKASYILYSGAVLHDVPKSIGLLHQSAAMGNSEAMFLLGTVFNSVRKYLPQNPDSAKYWYGRAANAGFVPAWVFLGNTYHSFPIDIEQDAVKAYNCFARGAALGDNQCVAWLGYCYYKGVGCIQDYAQAYTYLSQAAYNGNSTAMYYLALQYRNGYYLPRNADSANALLARAAAKKEKQAQGEINVTSPENPVEPITPPENSQIYNTGTYQRIKHNVNVKTLPGSYNGYAIRYDFSGQHILSIFPLQASFAEDGSNVTGKWVEGTDTAIIQASYTDSALLFANTAYRKKDHYSSYTNYKGHKTGEEWQFDRASFSLLQQPDSVYITGNIRLYSNWRKEFGQPLFVHLARATTLVDDANPTSVNLSALNPFHTQLPVTFTIASTTPVTLQLKTMQGQPILTDQSGILPPGTYRRTLNVPPSTANSSYILQLQTKNGNNSIIIIKQ